jgi:hypothetical protein
MTLRKRLLILGGIGIGVFARYGGCGSYLETYSDDDRIKNDVHIKDFIFFDVIERTVTYKPFDRPESVLLMKTRRSSFLPTEVKITREWKKN